MKGFLFNGQQEAIKETKEEEIGRENLIGWAERIASTSKRSIELIRKECVVLKAWKGGALLNR